MTVGSLCVPFRKVDQPFARIGLGARLVLVQKLLTNAAPRVLGVVSVLSVFVSCIGILYAFYALAAWAILDQVQPGWLTTSLVLSLTAVFLPEATSSMT